MKKTFLTGSFTFQNAVISVIIQLFDLPVKSAQFYHSKAKTKDICFHALTMKTVALQC